MDVTEGDLTEVQSVVLLLDAAAVPVFAPRNPYSGVRFANVVTCRAVVSKSTSVCRLSARRRFRSARKRFCTTRTHPNVRRARDCAASSG